MASNDTQTELTCAETRYRSPRIRPQHSALLRLDGISDRGIRRDDSSIVVASLCNRSSVLHHEDGCTPGIRRDVHGDVLDMPVVYDRWEIG